MNHLGIYWLNQLELYMNQLELYMNQLESNMNHLGVYWLNKLELYMNQLELYYPTVRTVRVMRISHKKYVSMLQSRNTEFPKHERRKSPKPPPTPPHKQVAFLPTVHVWLHCSSSSLFMRRWFHMWRFSLNISISKFFYDMQGIWRNNNIL